MDLQSGNNPVHRAGKAGFHRTSVASVGVGGFCGTLI